MKGIKWLVCMLVLIAAVGLTAGGALAAEATVTTFEEFKKALAENCDVIKLEQDITCGEDKTNFGVEDQITINRQVTLDLNGHKYEYKGIELALQIQDSGWLTLRDSSSGGNGVLTSSCSTIKLDEGRFTVESGRVEGSAAVEVLKDATDVTIEIRGGTVYSGNTNAMHLRGAARVYIIGGTIEAPTAKNFLSKNERGRGIESEQQIDLTFSGGTLKGTLYIEGGTYVVSGGARIEAVANEAAIVVRRNTGDTSMTPTEVRVTGGSFIGKEAGISVAETAELTVTGGSISGVNEAIEVVDPANPTIKVKGGDFSHAVSSYVQTGYTEISFKKDGATRYAVGAAATVVRDYAPTANSITVLKGSALTAPDGATVKNQTGGDLSINGITVAAGGETVAHDWIWDGDNNEHWKKCQNSSHSTAVADRGRHAPNEDICSICGQSVTHAWEWKSDSTGHWQTCGKHKDEVTSPVSHTMKSEQTGTGTVETCTVCGYKHNWKWEYNDTQHWQTCTEHAGEKRNSGSHKMEADATGNVETCTDGCGYSITHNWEWQHDDTQHWQTCTEHADEKRNSGSHKMEADATGNAETCTDGCGYSITHNWEWQHNDTQHWQTCTLHTGEEQNREPHSLDADGKCADCGYVKPAALPPQTGDAAPLGAWMALMAVSAAGLCAAMFRRRAHR